MLEALVATMNRHLGSVPELVVVDNLSRDDPQRAAREYRGQVRFMPLERNVGFGAACNIGVEKASGSCVVMLNPDTELVDASLDELAAFAMGRQALAGPRLLNPDGSVQPSASGTPVGPWPWVGAIIPGRLQPPPVSRRAEPWRARRTVRVAWLTGACVAAPRKALLALGPFDPAIQLYAEDMDLGLRAARVGIPSYFCPDVCRVIHRGGASTSIAFPQGAGRLAAGNRRAVVRRAYGARRERASWLAQRVNLRLRVAAKRALGRDASADRDALDATRTADSAPNLPALPNNPASV
jgi:GT2 family glycosyltransferase